MNKNSFICLAIQILVTYIQVDFSFFHHANQNRKIQLLLSLFLKLESATITTA